MRTIETPDEMVDRLYPRAADPFSEARREAATKAIHERDAQLNASAPVWRDRYFRLFDQLGAIADVVGAPRASNYEQGHVLAAVVALLKTPAARSPAAHDPEPIPTPEPGEMVFLSDDPRDPNWRIRVSKDSGPIEIVEEEMSSASPDAQVIEVTNRLLLTGKQAAWWRDALSALLREPRGTPRYMPVDGSPLCGGCGQTIEKHFMLAGSDDVWCPPSDPAKMATDRARNAFLGFEAAIEAAEKCHPHREHWGREQWDRIHEARDEIFAALRWDD